ncbi:TetR/AcrR family transcriptional regulator [Nonomuraea gerenzanensis]|uniref:Transcriptional regulator, TetR family n=1 Tax=Nonomuraea gerenzanensis TaxID=93944 RepID=A0A1M4DYU6_9ACTN|nr:helix-turn-helix domain-containing protein [Nonomuraea gerenzanensis]UBU14015.1 TetR/AcrR family transcriptional regulator [Nonomuraea gerenzanensis]SBO91700.1 Transcriptional regulator, TetR family [Nonomuraea gerenzanensis]
MPDIKHFDPEATLDQVVDLFWRRGADATGIADVVQTTGLSRSSLYATFGGKAQLQAAALGRYLERRSRPVFETLAADDRGVPAVAAFFERLVAARCSGEHARWGCLVTNTHATAGGELPEVREILDRHHDALRAALRAALVVARAKGQLRAGVDVEAAAEALTLQAYAVNLRSRAGAEAGVLLAGVRAVLDGLTEER